MSSSREGTPAVTRPGRDGRRGREGERGQVIILFTLFIVMILGFAAMVVDIGVLRNASQNLWNSLDSGALAGAAYLPADGTSAKTVGMTYADSNYPGGLPASRVALSFRCLLGDRNNDGLPDMSDIPTTCDPGPTAASAWKCARGICTAPCDPAEGDLCNTLVLAGSVSVPFRFGGAVGVNSGDTNVVVSAACKGPCGSLPVTPVDVALIVDRTGSMSGVDTTNARTAADSVRSLYNPAAQWLSFGMLGPSNVGGGCRRRRPRRSARPTCRRTFVAGCPSASRARARHSPPITPRRPRRWRRPSPATRTPAPVPTSHDPIPMAQYELTEQGRAGVHKGIILMTDGQPNATTSATSNYCLRPTTPPRPPRPRGSRSSRSGSGSTPRSAATPPAPTPPATWKGKIASAAPGRTWRPTQPPTTIATPPRTTTTTTSFASGRPPARPPT